MRNFDAIFKKFIDDLDRDMLNAEAERATNSGITDVMCGESGNGKASLSNLLAKSVESMQRERAPRTAQALVRSAKTAAAKYFYCGLCNGVFNAREFIDHQSVDCGRKSKPKPTRSEMALFGHRMGVVTTRESFESGEYQSAEHETCRLCGQTYEQIIAPDVPLKCGPDARWQEYKRERHELMNATNEHWQTVGRPLSVEEFGRRYTFVDGELVERRSHNLARAMSIDTHHTIAERIAPYRGSPNAQTKGA